MNVGFLWEYITAERYDLRSYLLAAKVHILQIFSISIIVYFNAIMFALNIPTHTFIYRVLHHRVYIYRAADGTEFD